MTPTPEQIAAFADGQLAGAEHDAVAAAIAADSCLQHAVQQHQALRSMLGRHYAPIAQETVPDSLKALLAQPVAPDADAAAQVIDFAAARAKRQAPRWIWAAAPALAASLVLTVVLRPWNAQPQGYAGTELASTLDTRLAADGADGAGNRILLSFRDDGGAYCRAFAGKDDSGIACHDGKGWKLQATGKGGAAQQTEYRTAGSLGDVMAAAQTLASGPALDADQERSARATGWRKD